MRRLSALIGFGTLGLLLTAAGCGDDTSGGADTRTGADTILADAGDDVAADTTIATEDAATGDTAAADDTAAPADTVTPTDTAVADTAVADTAVADTALTDTTVEDTGSGPDTTDPHPCSAAPAAHTRHVVLSYPVAADMSQTNVWKAFPLNSDGSISATGTTFTMGYTAGGVVAFSPDGSLGFAVQEDGTLGVFRLGDDGQVTVISAGADPGVYADRVVVDGDRLLIINPNWPASGGGVYAAGYDCDGNIKAAQLLYETKNAHGVVTREGDQLVVSRAAGDTTFGHLHLMREGTAGWHRAAGADLFGHDEASLSALAVTGDGRYALVGQNAEFSAEPNVIGVAALGTDTIAPEAPVSFNDPVALVVSPYDDAVLAVSGYGNDVHVLAYDPGGVAPFTDLGTPTYVTQKPQLPADAVLVGGDHPDLVFVVETLAVRRFRFEGGGVVTDLGRSLEFSEGFVNMPGAIGVQP
ncbi:MAG: hypothetical protein EP329_11035 [Deltaproteobacteria bacterium]|nr:MAG: hypothetical protein EP329_11035 [Deltaproteobacteria bacterium]